MQNLNIDQRTTWWDIVHIDIVHIDIVRAMSSPRVVLATKLNVIKNWQIWKKIY